MYLLLDEIENNLENPLPSFPHGEGERRTEELLFEDEFPSYFFDSLSMYLIFEANFVWAKATC